MSNKTIAKFSAFVIFAGIADKIFLVCSLDS